MLFKANNIKNNCIEQDQIIQNLIKAANDHRKNHIINKALIGVSQSQHALGLIFNFGGYFKKNIEMAKYWYKKAAFNESASSCNNLAIIYLK